MCVCGVRLYIERRIQNTTKGTGSDELWVNSKPEVHPNLSLKVLCVPK